MQETRFGILLNRLTDYDVISHDLHMIITIRPSVFVPEANHMSKLVHDDTELVAVFAYGYGLWAVAALTHKRTTPGKWKKKTFINKCQKIK